ncbi:winged helix-turn-helix transcriptional regulator [Flavobacterium sp. HTF]|uniref:winged helix-turn-helix transcriptional regulator n=1 Tax=Flavobacterium sp. HTF TaxID=2170732 RepID=UPI000D5CB6CA|nr:helix-turn-helix domain-containing protein [Flavobacterium sp. HTF]PWB27192.1 transcriptional regulator [Flavobacterium sp. HTF]
MKTDPKDKVQMDQDCSKNDLMAVKDALEVLSGRWKLQILICLLDGSKRFKEISKEVVGISDKMLSKELKDLETNQLVKRTVHETFPPMVEYTATEHTSSLYSVIAALKNWGYLHREKIIG